MLELEESTLDTSPCRPNSKLQVGERKKEILILARGGWNFACNKIMGILG